jgi:hypothetical protein
VLSVAEVAAALDLSGITTATITQANAHNPVIFMPARFAEASHAVELAVRS